MIKAEKTKCMILDKEEIRSFYTSAREHAQQYFKDKKLITGIEARAETGKLWVEKSPQTEKDFKEFYETCDYIDELVEWHYTKKFISAFKVVNILHTLPCSTILDFGGGIGSDSFAYEKIGKEVTYYDINNINKEFTRFRKTQFNSNIEIFEGSEQQLLSKKFDAVIFFDVIGHLKDPISYIEKLGEMTRNLIFTQDLNLHDEKHGGQPHHVDFPVQKVYKRLSELGFIKQKVSMAFPPQFWSKI